MRRIRLGKVVLGQCTEGICMEVLLPSRKLMYVHFITEDSYEIVLF